MSLHILQSNGASTCKLQSRKDDECKIRGCAVQYIMLGNFIVGTDRRQDT